MNLPQLGGVGCSQSYCIWHLILAHQFSTMKVAVPYQVFVLIPVYNRKNTTLACLEHLQEIGDLGLYSIVVIDDGSTDGTSDAIRAQFPTVKILEGDGNLWWTGAICKGMEYAKNQGADYLIWLNDDCHPLKQTLAQLITLMSSDPNMIVAPTCRLSLTGKLVDNGYSKGQRLTAQKGDICPVKTVNGYCVGLPMAVYDRIGLPDAQRFPHYCGDDTYILRANRAGYTIWIVGDACVELTNAVDPEHTFRRYVACRFATNLSFREVFLNCKSRYYLPSQFFYQIERFYPVKGTLFFGAKLIMWLGQYLYLWFKIQTQSLLAFAENKE